VLLENGKYGIIKRVTFQQLEIPETTYNFEVEDYHTYYIGEEGILVHNMDCSTTVETIETKVPDVMKISDATQAWDDFLDKGNTISTH